MLGGASLPLHWTLEEPLCEQNCSPDWRDCLGQVTWAIPWSPGSLPLGPRVPVTALKPLRLLFSCLSSSPGPSSMGNEQHPCSFPIPSSQLGSC